MTSPYALPSRTCQLKECKQSFEPVTSWQEYCSPKCRNRAMSLERKEALALLRSKKKQTVKS